jgi:hypothetical protein
MPNTGSGKSHQCGDCKKTYNLTVRAARLSTSIIDREEQKEIDAERKADEDAAKAVKDANSFWNVPAKTRKDERDDDSKGGKSYKGKGKGRAR